MSEISATLQWLKAQLAGIAPGGVHTGAAPPGVATPFLTINQYGGSDRMNMSGVRLWVVDTWLIEAWGPDTDYAAVTSAAKAADAKLHRQSGTTADGTILMAIRTNDRLAFPMVGGAQWIRQGGTYEVLTQES